MPHGPSQFSLLRRQKFPSGWWQDLRLMLQQPSPPVGGATGAEVVGGEGCETGMSVGGGYVGGVGEGGSLHVSARHLPYPHSSTCLHLYPSQQFCQS